MRTLDAAIINEGDTVYGSDGKSIGSVQYCEEGFCKIDTGFAGLGMDYYVPADAVLNTSPGEVFLNVPSTRISRMGWERPPEQIPTGGRQEVITAEECEQFGRSAEEEVGETEPM